MKKPVRMEYKIKEKLESIVVDPALHVIVLMGFKTMEKLESIVVGHVQTAVLFHVTLVHLTVY